MHITMTMVLPVNAASDVNTSGPPLANAKKVTPATFGGTLKKSDMVVNVGTKNSSAHRLSIVAAIKKGVNCNSMR
jgi:hypothetical protein